MTDLAPNRSLLLSVFIAGIKTGMPRSCRLFPGTAIAEHRLIGLQLGRLHLRLFIHFFCRKLGIKTPDWLIASAFTNKFIIFEPSKIEKYTCHNKNEFEQLITHETSHILLKELNPNCCAWMNEGIALNIAKQEKRKDIKSENISHFIKNSLFKNSKYETFISKQGYDISYRLIKFLLENYNKKIMLGLFKIDYKSSKSTEKDVCRVLGQNKNKLIDQFTKILKTHE
jgi:hypothetical protein